MSRKSLQELQKEFVPATKLEQFYLRRYLNVQWRKKQGYHGFKVLRKAGFLDERFEPTARGKMALAELVRKKRRSNGKSHTSRRNQKS